MKLRDITNCEYVVWLSAYGCNTERVDDDVEYKRISFSRTTTLGELKQDEPSVADVIIYNEDVIDDTEAIDVYNAITEDGEGIEILVCSSWV